MALVLKDRVKEGTTTSGTGTVVLLGAAPGYQTFAVIGNGNQTYYAISGGSDYEVGIGTYYSGNTSLSRDTILASSNANAAVVLSGTYDVFVTYPAEEAVYVENGAVFANGSSNVTFTNINVTNGSFLGNVTITSGTINAVPNAATDIVNKTYVDALVSSGVHFHQPVRVESPTALVAVYNQPNGAGNGVGATLTNSGANVSLVVDGIAVANTNRVLVYTQSNAVQNGVYVVSDIGSNVTSWILTRSDDTNTYGLTSPNTLGEGSTFFVQEGDTGAGETYTCNTPGVITFGTSNITFTQISSAQIYSAGTGLSLNNTTFSISNTAVTAGTYGDAGNVSTITVNAQGQLTNAVNTAIVIPSSSVTGLGTMALQNATTVAITGGSINGTLIGNATASSGAFTDLTASGNVTGVGFANFLNAPPTIGGVTANTGAFTSLSASGTLTASANVVVTQRTGYLFANNSSPVTASTTIPNTAITGLGTMSTQNANAVAITGGTINNVSLSNITYGGLGTMATQNANAVAITGGAINGTVLGNTGASTAIFTNMNTTTGNATTFNATSSTITNLISTNAAINGGAINNTLIGNATASTAVFTNMNTTTGNATTMNVTSSTITNLRSSNVAITGGAINGTLVGNATPSSGAFTTLTASANVNFDSGLLFVDATNNRVGVNSTTTFGLLTSTGNFGNGTSVNFVATPLQTAQGQISGYSFRSTFQGTADNGARRSADIWSGYNAGNWGTEYLSFGVGIGGQNDGATQTTERMRITGAGNVGIGNTAPASKLTVAGVIQSTTGGVTFPDNTTQTTAAGLVAGNSSIIINNVNITANATIAAGQNGFSVGPITTANGVSVTVSAGQQWVVL
jgi:hypothetical protein